MSAGGLAELLVCLRAPAGSGWQPPKIPVLLAQWSGMARGFHSVLHGPWELLTPVLAGVDKWAEQMLFGGGSPGCEGKSVKVWKMHEIRKRFFGVVQVKGVRQLFFLCLDRFAGDLKGSGEERKMLLIPGRAWSWDFGGLVRWVSLRRGPGWPGDSRQPTTMAEWWRRWT